MSMDDEGEGPVGFLGRVRERKGIVWITIIALVVLTVGGTTIDQLAQALGGR